MPMPLLKPPCTMSTEVKEFSVFEVELARDTITRFDPLSRQAYSVDDAILALAQSLKEGGLTPDDFLKHFEASTFLVSQTKVIVYDQASRNPKVFPVHRMLPVVAHEAIVKKLREFYPSAPVGGGVAQVEYTAPAVAPEEAMQMISMVNSGSTAQTAASQKPAARPRRLITQMGSGGGEDKQRAVQEAIAVLTPENMPKGGCVVTIGKDGKPRILKTAGSRTEEEENEAFADDEAEGISIDRGDYQDRGQEIQVVAAPVTKTAAKDPAPKPAVKTARVMSESALESMAQASAQNLTPSHMILSPDGGVANVDAATSAAMMDGQFGVKPGDSPDPEVVLPEVVDSGSAPLAKVGEKSGHTVKRPAMRTGRGGVRPGKE